MNNTPLEDRKILFRALCAMAPYKTKAQTLFQTAESLIEIKKVRFLTGYKIDTMYYWAEGSQSRYLYKPYLFPLSSMTREQLDDFYKTIRPVIEDSLRESSEWRKRQEENGLPGEMPITLSSIKCETASVHWMLERHFDIYGLIPKDLAIDATGKNIY